MKTLRERLAFVRAEIERMDKQGKPLASVPEMSRQPLVLSSRGFAVPINENWVIVRTLQELGEFEKTADGLPDRLTESVWDQVVRKFWKPLGMPEGRRPLRKTFGASRSRRSGPARQNSLKS
jgi:hypothetical protein